MNVIGRSTISGAVKAPPSKSGMIRVLGAAGLARGESFIRNPSFCEDSLRAMEIVRAFGAEVATGGGHVKVSGRDVRHGPAEAFAIECGESGLCMRMFVSVAALAGVPVTLHGSGSLRSRPVGMVGDLRQLGVSCESAGGFPPVRITGPLQGGRIAVDGSESSQFLTGLLMALPLCPADSCIVVRDLASKPYIALTLEIVSDFGISITHDGEYREFHIPGGQDYRPGDHVIEGDWSGAAFLLVAGALAGSVTVEGLSLRSRQADKSVLDALGMAGAEVRAGEGGVTVSARDLRAFEFDAVHAPDMVPPLAALAAHCEGKSRIRNVERLRHKESDRLAALAGELGKMGARLTVADGDMFIEGGTTRGDAVIDPHNDHRIAMACAVAALGSSEPVAIMDPAVVGKSYPRFFDDLDLLRGKK